jgi:hypothetical protein
VEEHERKTGAGERASEFARNLADCFFMMFMTLKLFSLQLHADDERKLSANVSEAGADFANKQKLDPKPDVRMIRSGRKKELAERGRRKSFSVSFVTSKLCNQSRDQKYVKTKRAAGTEKKNSDWLKTRPRKKNQKQKNVQKFSFQDFPSKLSSFCVFKFEICVVSKLFSVRDEPVLITPPLPECLKSILQCNMKNRKS